MNSKILLGDDEDLQIIEENRKTYERNHAKETSWAAFAGGVGHAVVVRYQ